MNSRAIRSGYLTINGASERAQAKREEWTRKMSLYSPYRKGERESIIMNQPGVYTRLLDKISIVKLNSLDLIQSFQMPMPPK